LAAALERYRDMFPGTRCNGCEFAGPREAEAWAEEQWDIIYTLIAYDLANDYPALCGSRGTNWLTVMYQVYGTGISRYLRQHLQRVFGWGMCCAIMPFNVICGHGPYVYWEGFPCFADLPSDSRGIAEALVGTSFEIRVCRYGRPFWEPGIPLPPGVDVEPGEVIV
jgi:hypothetical protein